VNLVRAAAVVGSNTMLSRVLGFVRDVAMANVLGAGVVSDAFFVAFKLANFLRRLFAEGAFNAAFVPMFSRALERGGRADALRFAGEAFAGLALVLTAVVVVAELFMADLVGVLAGGYGPDDPRFPLAVELSHLTFPYILLISLAALLGGVLNAVGRFGAAAFAPVLLNLVLIAALLASPWLPVGPAHALAWGVLVAGVAQLAFLARAARRAEMWPTLTRPRWNPRIKRLALLVLPGALGAGVAQVNMLVDLWFASHLPPGAQSYLFYADRLNQLPLGVVGIAVGTALLPVLSREVAAGETVAGRRTLNRAVQLALLLTLPATAALVLIAEPIVVGLFERGAFDREASRATAATVQAFAVGLPAYVLVKVMAPAFFAREDTRTPVYVAAAALVANVVLILLFIDALAHVGIALATALANWLNVVCLALLLARAGWFRPDRALAAGLAATLAATLVMAAALVAVDRVGADWPVLVRLAALVGVGGGVFGLAALALGAVPAELRRLVTRKAAP
jgi:putative peptidoglycan lipid II flippase